MIFRLVGCGAEDAKGRPKGKREKTDTRLYYDEGGIRVGYFLCA
jgi:hypothetical protein